MPLCLTSGIVFFSVAPQSRYVGVVIQTLCLQCSYTERFFSFLCRAFRTYDFFCADVTMKAYDSGVDSMTSYILDWLGKLVVS